MKMVVFDMDGTLIAESSWELLHQYFHADPEKVRQNREAYFQQRIDYETWMEKDILLWNSPTPTLEAISEGLSHYTLEPFVHLVVDSLKAQGILSCIVSSGIYTLAAMVGADLGIDTDLIHANELVFVRGVLRGVLRVEPYKKDDIVRKIAQEREIPLEEVAAVGDAASDVSSFKTAGLTFAYNPKDDLIVKAADYVLDDLRELLDFC
jgi:phosphoserine phosphatase